MRFLFIAFLVAFVIHAKEVKILLLFSIYENYSYGANDLFADENGLYYCQNFINFFI